MQPLALWYHMRANGFTYVSHTLATFSTTLLNQLLVLPVNDIKHTTLLVHNAKDHTGCQDPPGLLHPAHSIISLNVDQGWHIVFS
jgi:hypothetical protein